MWLDKRGQIRGVDFALALVVYIIILSQVLLLTVSFLNPQFEHERQLNEVADHSSMRDSILFSEGTPKDWGLTSSQTLLDGRFSLGLGSGKYGEISPFKLYRIASTTAPSMVMNYEDIHYPYEYDGGDDFSISTSPVIDLEILDIVLDENYGVFDFFMQFDLNSGGYTELFVTTYIVDNNLDIVEYNTTTPDSTGYTRASVDTELVFPNSYERFNYVIFFEGANGISGYYAGMLTEAAEFESISFRDDVSALQKTYSAEWGNWYKIQSTIESSSIILTPYRENDATCDTGENIFNSATNMYERTARLPVEGPFVILFTATIYRDSSILGFPSYISPDSPFGTTRDPDQASTISTVLARCGGILIDVTFRVWT